MNDVHFMGGESVPRIIEEPEELIFTTAKRIMTEEGFAQINMRKMARECDIAI